MADADETAFSRWLRKELPRKGYPLEGPRAGGKARLAVDADVAPATVTRLISGQAEPSVDSLRKIGQALGYSLVEMLLHAGLVDPEELTAAGLVQADELTTADLEMPPSGRPRYRPDEILPGVEKMMDDLKDQEEPEEPPGGFLHEGERDIWGLWRVPWPVRYALILMLRAIFQARLGTPARVVNRSEDPLHIEGGHAAAG